MKGMEMSKILLPPYIIASDETGNQYNRKQLNVVSWYLPELHLSQIMGATMSSTYDSYVFL